MKFKSLFYALIFLIFAAGCNESVIESEANTQEQSETAGLKAGTIGTSYYVSKSGNDSNAGTTGSPFLTIQKAANVVNPGDTVIIKDGTYTTTNEVFVNLTRTGKADGYITFRSEHKWGAVLDGLLAPDGSSGGRFAFDINSGASYIKIQDFEIRNFRNAAVTSNDQVLTSSYIEVQGNKIHDNGRFSNTVEEDGAVGIYARKKSHHWTINSNLIYNIGRTGPNDLWLNKDHAVYTGQTEIAAEAAHHFTITNNIMFGCSGVAVVLCSTNDLVANNVMAWSNENSAGGSPLMAFQIFVTDLVIANNIFFEPPATSHNYALANIGNVVRWTVKNNMVYGGSMWNGSSVERTAAMAGGNYGQTDCEHAEVNPLFVNAVKANAPNVDFNLQSGSPAINAGVDLGLTASYQGNPIIGLPDLGACEYAVSDPSPTASTTLASTPIPTPIPTVYYNTQKSATTTKSDCGTGYAGSMVTYTVSASKYSSAVSQTDADNKAVADVESNKQAYADANGTCTALPSTVYYNTEVSATITKKNCATGYNGSLVTYSVEANKYSSTISQADADNKALADLYNNKQAYADANGTCIAVPSTVYYNTQVSATATKNDCGTGYTGTKVTYTVSAGKYSSTVSQSDANEQATSDLINNEQAYANANGYCTPLKISKRRR